MKSAIYPLLLSISLLALVSCQGPQTKTYFFTQGNCTECKVLIEDLLRDATGVDSVGWDMDMSLTVVKYRPRKTNPDRLQKILSSGGFMTQFYPADSLAAKQIPACCSKPIERKLKRKKLEIPGH